MKRHRTTQQHEMKRGRHNGNAHEQRRKAPRTPSTRAHAHENCKRTWMSASVHGSRVVGIEGRVDDYRARHRNTDATVVMAGCTNGDRVDEVRVGHVRQVEHGAVLMSRVRSEMMRSRGFMGLNLKKLSFRAFQRKLPTLHFLLHFLHRDRAWVCAPKGTYYLPSSGSMLLACHVQVFVVSASPDRPPSGRALPELQRADPKYRVPRHQPHAGIAEPYWR